MSIFTFSGLLTKNLYEKIHTNTQKSVDRFVEQFNKEGEFKPVQGQAFFLPHTNSKKYPSGTYVNDCISEDVLTDTQKDEALQLFSIYNEYEQDSAYFSRYISSIMLRFSLIDISDEDKLYQLALDILPPAILQDRQLLLDSGIPAEKVEQLQAHTFKYNSLFVSEEQKRRLFEEMKDQHFEELFEKYYALSLLFSF